MYGIFLTREVCSSQAAWTSSASCSARGKLPSVVGRLMDFSVWQTMREMIYSERFASESFIDVLAEWFKWRINLDRDIHYSWTPYDGYIFSEQPSVPTWMGSLSYRPNGNNTGSAPLPILELFVFASKGTRGSKFHSIDRDDGAFHGWWRLQPEKYGSLITGSTSGQ